MLGAKAVLCLALCYASCPAAAAAAAAAEGGGMIEPGNWMEERLIRVLAGVLATADEGGRGALPPCAGLDAVLEQVFAVDRKYYDPRANARLVAMLVHACGGLPAGTATPGLAHDGGVPEARARVAAALQASADHEFAARWSPECARVDARSEGFSWERFVADFVLPGIPVAIAGLGAAELGPGVERWRDVAYLREHFGGTVHRAGVFDSSNGADRMGIMPYNSSDARSWAARHNNGEILRHTYKEAKPLATLLDPAFTAGGRSWFAEQSELWGLPSTADGFTDTSRPPTASFPKMWAELREPVFTAQCQLQSVNFWAGALDPAGVHASKNSALHFDKDDGFLHQISGRKTWTLFHRHDSHNLYMKWWHLATANKPAPAGSHGRGRMSGEDLSEIEDEHRRVLAGELDVRNTVNNFSPLHPHAPDLARFPRFRRARPMTCRTAPGDTIFVPAFTWHDVNSTHAPGQINAAVNFWTMCQPGEYDTLMELLHDTLRLDAWELQYGAPPPFMKTTLAKHPGLVGKGDRTTGGGGGGGGGDAGGSSSSSSSSSSADDEGVAGGEDDERRDGGDDADEEEEGKEEEVGKERDEKEKGVEEEAEEEDEAEEEEEEGGGGGGWLEAGLNMLGLGKSEGQKMMDAAVATAGKGRGGGGKKKKKTKKTNTKKKKKKVPKWGGPGYRQDDPAADHNGAAIDASEGGDYPFALRSFRAAVRFQPAGPELWANLGMALLDEPGPAAQREARAALEKALELEPANKQALALMKEMGWKLAKGKGKGIRKKLAEREAKKETEKKKPAKAKAKTPAAEDFDDLLDDVRDDTHIEGAASGRQDSEMDDMVDEL
jgi:tetratricopeptide (TPR) repeat protein